jgi:fructose-1,6-bisphosphatase/inositol monophosphatase family enzyme
MPLVKNANKDFVLPLYRNSERQDISTKTGDYDLVTKADKAAEEYLIRQLTHIYPNCIAVGEETLNLFPEKFKNLMGAELGFLIDPVDGTLNFVQGISTFGTIVAVLNYGKVIGGLLYDPLVDDWVIADKDSRAWYMSNTTSKPLYKEHAKAPMVILNSFREEFETQLKIKNVFEGLGIPRTMGSSAFDYRMTIMGSSIACLSYQTQPWDHAAGSFILEKAGGKSAFVDGEPYSLLRTEGPLLFTKREEDWDEIANKLQFLI